MKSYEIRNSFLKYFEKNKHQIVPSSKLIPENDNTLLFTNAGMNQFKNIFLGYEKRNYSRAVSSQKCVRAGGKHNDLEQVGFTARHHTFFEMLGNFSFGDYFKKEAIHFAWEFLTKELSIPKDKLYITVFETDDEAAEIWHKQEGVPKDRIFRFGEKDNFWRMGDTGPCGPCTEIFFDHGEKTGTKKGAKFGEDDQRFVEIWNLVFMQFFEESPGKMSPLPKPSVDTGAGLERISAVMQNVYMNYDTDLFQPIIQKAAGIAKVSYLQNGEIDTALRVLSDHARACAFLIADGVLPSNEGRGYVLRRILRRAIRYSRKLSDRHSLFLPATEELISQMKPYYPELSSYQDVITKTIQSEENSFLQTLDKGTDILNQEIQNIKNKGLNVLSGDFLFKLYDTFGFPMDLTRLMSAEQNVGVDENGFEQKMEQARKKSQTSWKGQQAGAETGHLIELSQKIAATEFLGYQTLFSKSRILALSDGKKTHDSLTGSGFLVVDKTPFYAESGGQVGDQGSASTEHSKFDITDCTKIGPLFIHQFENANIEIKVGDLINLEVDPRTRSQTAHNHSATHLLHAALRKTLGKHVTQAGSLVEPQRLRFDFTHDKPLSEDELLQIEVLVNNEIQKKHSVTHQIMSYEGAIESGALALFGEKYGDSVRVLKMGDFSTELCGGTHVKNTSEIGSFRFLSETGVSRGVRRVEAVTGDMAKSYSDFKFELDSFCKKIKSSSPDLIDEIQRESMAYASDSRLQTFKLNAVMNEIQSALKELLRLKERNKTNKNLGEIDFDEIIKASAPIPGGKFLFYQINSDDRKTISEIVDRLRDKLSSCVVVVLGRSETELSPIVAAVSKNLTTQFHAGKIIQELANQIGGKGGGRPDFAQGSIAFSDSNTSTIKDSLHSILRF